MKLRDHLDNIKTQLVNDIEVSFIDGVRKIPRPNSVNPINIKKNQVLDSLDRLIPSNIDNYQNDFVQNLHSIRSYLSFCSSPKAFRTAWDLRSLELNGQDAETILNQGGQFIPFNKDSRIFKYEQQGVLYDESKRFLKAIRHVEGNYDDKLDDLGKFTYQPPENISGMLRYRIAEKISQVSSIPYVLLVIMWFKYRINNNLNHVFTIAPAKITSIRQSNNIDKHIHKHLDLQLINRSEASSILNLFLSLNETSLEIDVRRELPDSLSREWSYDKVNSSNKGKQLKRWSKNTGKKCPGECNREFIDISNSDIAFGHIVSQNWCKSFTYLLDKVNHPDNLYLTCKKCNSSLGDKFPDVTLRNKIISYGTIGDWLRKNLTSIRKS
tara:strand:- start:85 stop:1230 length:1146 start_codon:yes stop_codon:yes gene_type:complete